MNPYEVLGVSENADEETIKSVQRIGEKISSRQIH